MNPFDRPCSVCSKIVSLAEETRPWTVVCLDCQDRQEKEFHASPREPKPYEKIPVNDSDPEGFKKFIEQLKWCGYDLDDMPIETVVEMAILLKEMAEALSDLTSQKGKEIESGVWEENQAGRILQKFREWK